MEIPELKDHGFALLLHNALTDEFCDKTIEKLNKKKWEDALINGGGKQVLDKEIRDCKRIMEIDEELSAFVMGIIKKHLPEEFGNKFMIDLNPMFRYLKYGPGNYFRPHYDLRYTDKLGRVSLITVQMYLNDDFKGGETVFFDDNERKIYTHIPKKGDIILFEQGFEHAGSEVTEGTKYSVRTEVMYG
jgi:prolyl 4-hydroxylase